MEFASKPVYLAVANGAPATLVPGNGVIFGLAMSCGAVCQITIRTADQATVLGVIRTPANQTVQWTAWPTAARGIHITNDTAATTADVTAFVGNANG